MQVAAEFMRSTATVEQSPIYVDVESGKAREIDVVATYQVGRIHKVSAVVECKATMEPLVVLIPAEGDFFRHRCLSRGAYSSLVAFNYRVAMDQLNATALFDLAIPVGHSLITKTTKDKPEDKGWAAANGGHEGGSIHRDTI